MIQEFNFLSEHLKDSRTWQKIDECKDYKLRPSSKEKVGNTHIFTWEVKPNKTS